MELTSGYISAVKLLVARQPEYEARAVLQRALVCARERDVFELVEAALDLAEEHCVWAALAKLPQSPSQKRLQQRAERMFSLARMPESVRPKGWTPVPGRVAYVLYSSLPWFSTGYAVRSHRLAQSLRKAGVDLQCLTRPGFPWDEDPAALSENMPMGAMQEDEISGVPYLRMLEPQFNRWPNYQTYVRGSADALMTRFLDLRPEVVMAASSHACALPAMIAARRLGIPFIYDMRGFWELSRVAREPDFLGSPQYRYERWLETQVAQQADHVFTLSPPMRNALIGRGVPKERISYLPNGCDPDSFAPSGRGRRMAAELGVQNEVPIIGYAGSFPAYEGLEDLVVAAAALKGDGYQFRLVLVGSEHGTGLRGTPITQALRSQAEKLGLGDWLIMPGRVPFEHVPDWLDFFDICVFPRRPLLVTETVAPLKPVEAMAAGKAIVLSSVAGMQGLLQDGESGLVFTKGEIGDLQRQLGRLLQDPELRSRLGRSARARAQADYAWSSIAKRMLERLQETAIPRK